MQREELDFVLDVPGGRCRALSRRVTGRFEIPETSEAQSREGVGGGEGRPEASYEARFEMMSLFRKRWGQREEGTHGLSFSPQNVAMKGVFLMRLGLQADTRGPDTAGPGPPS